MNTLTPKSVFKNLFIVGCGLLIISLFLDWYHYKVFMSNHLVSSWNFNPFLEWTTELLQENLLNQAFRPPNLEISLYLSGLFIGVLVVSIFSALTKDVENEAELSSYRTYSFIFALLVLLNSYYVLFFPTNYLLPNSLYYPFLEVQDFSRMTVTSYSYGFGYIIQCIALPMLIPYTLFFYKTVSNFEQKRETPEQTIQNHAKKQIDYLDLDRSIQEENLAKKGIINNKLELENLKTRIYGG